MSSVDLIDSRVKVEQCALAVAALHEFQLKKDALAAENELLGKEQSVWLNVAVKKVAATKKLMPVRIPVVHPLVDPRTSGVCLITKDPQREYKDLLETNNIKFISRVIGISKLKGKFKPYEARRLLLKENGLFLADDRVIPLLPKLLGEKWFNAKKQPIPVTLSRKDLKKELEYAITSTYMSQNRGTNTAIKIGNMSHTPEQILANLKSALPVVAQRISGGWDNIQAFSIKTNSSVSLPIWSCSLDDKEMGRFAEKLDTTSEPAKKRKREDDEKKTAAKAQTVDGTPDKKKKKSDDVVPKEKPSKKAAPAAPMVVDEPAPTPAPEVPAAKVDKKKKSKKAEVAAEEPMVVDVPQTTPAKEKGKAAADVVVDTVKSTPSKEKKTKKTAVAVDESKAETPKESKPKASKRKSIVPEVAAAVEEVKEPETKKASKKSAKAVVPETPTKEETKAEQTVETPAKKEKKKKAAESPAKEVETTETAAPEKKEKKKAKTTDMTADELKTKKSGAPGEKKKEKVVKAKGGKSAKEGILGKKGLSR